MAADPLTNAELAWLRAWAPDTAAGDIALRAAAEVESLRAALHRETIDDAPGLVETLFRELYRRAGFDGWWDGIDADTQGEITNALRAIVRRRRSL